MYATTRHTTAHGSSSSMPRRSTSARNTSPSAPIPATITRTDVAVRDGLRERAREREHGQERERYARAGLA